MAKQKYSLETRLAVINHNLSGKGGAKRTADFFGIEGTSVRCWVRAWQLHGIDGITWKNDRHSPEFRDTVVRHWVNVYKASGQKGLLSIKHGRSKTMSKPPKTSPLTDVALEKLSPAVRAITI